MRWLCKCKKLLEFARWDEAYRLTKGHQECFQNVQLYLHKEYQEWGEIFNCYNKMCPTTKNCYTGMKIKLDERRKGLWYWITLDKCVKAQITIRFLGGVPANVVDAPVTWYSHKQPKITYSKVPKTTQQYPKVPTYKVQNSSAISTIRLENEKWMQIWVAIGCTFIVVPHSPFHLHSRSTFLAKTLQFNISNSDFNRTFRVSIFLATLVALHFTPVSQWVIN